MYCGNHLFEAFSKIATENIFKNYFVEYDFIMRTETIFAIICYNKDLYDSLH